VLRKEIDAIIAEKQTDRLRRKIELANRLYVEVLREVPGYWTGVFQRLQTQKDTMSDPVRAEHLYERGRMFIENNNLPGLRSVVFDLWKLCPDDVKKDSEGAGAAVNITL
jgi:hypothetical protein